MTVLVASTMARYVCDREDTSLSWLKHAEEMRELSPEPLEFFATLENDASTKFRYPGAFDGVIERIASLGGQVYRYRYEDGRDEITTGNRLWHIVCGRNLIQDRAMDIGASHILFLDADMEPPADCIPRLLELNWPMTGGHVPTYNLSGDRVCWRGVNEGDLIPSDADDRAYPEEWNVQQHMNTAGFLLVAREVFKRIRWRHCREDEMTDDPCYEQDVREFLGYPTYVRHSVVGKHYPESILPIERRFPDRDMSVKP